MPDHPQDHKVIRGPMHRGAVATPVTTLASYTAGKEIDNVGEHFSGRSNISNPYDLSPESFRCRL
jgi:hypothetical protein